MVEAEHTLKNAHFGPPKRYDLLGAGARELPGASTNLTKYRLEPPLVLSGVLA